MSTGKKVLNVFGIIFAWILSILLVILLYVSPVLLSSMSALKPSKLADIAASLKIAEIAPLMGEGTVDPENEEMMAILSTNAMQEVYEIYVRAVFGVLDGSNPQEVLSEEQLRQIVHTNIDELYEIVKKQTPEVSQLPEEDGKKMVEALFSSAMLELTTEFPTPEALMQSLAEEAPEAQLALQALKQVDIIKLSFVMMLVVLSGLVFVCRLWGFRGIRWLSVDLFVATGFSGMVCLGLGMSSSLIGMLAAEEPLLGVVATQVLSVVATGTYIRTAIMLVAAIGLLVAYIFIKKAIAKKQAAPVAPALPAEPEQAPTAE